MTMTEAALSIPIASIAPSWRARSAREASRSLPLTHQPSRRNAMPTEPPIRPVPTMFARRGAGVGTSGLLGEVVTQGARALQVDVVELGAPGFDVHQHPDAERLSAFYVQLPGAKQRYVAETDRARSRRGNIERMSSVAVNSTEIMSECSSPLRSNIAWSSAWARCATWSALSTSTVVAPRTARIRRGAAGLSGGSSTMARARIQASAAPSPIGRYFEGPAADRGLRGLGAPCFAALHNAMTSLGVSSRASLAGGGRR